MPRHKKVERKRNALLLFSIRHCYIVIMTDDYLLQLKKPQSPFTHTFFCKNEGVTVIVLFGK